MNCYDTREKKLTAIRLKELRQEKNLSHERLAEELNNKYGNQSEEDNIISVGVLKNYEVSDEFHSKFNTGFGMNIRYLAMFADYYKVSFDYLLGYSDTPIRQYHDTRELIGLSDHAIYMLSLMAKSAEENKKTYINELLSMPDFFVLLSDISVARENFIRRSIYNEEKNKDPLVFAAREINNKKRWNSVTLDPDEYNDFFLDRMKNDFIKIVNKIITEDVTEADIEEEIERTKQEEESSERDLKEYKTKLKKEAIKEYKERGEV